MQDLEGFYNLIESELQNLPYDKCYKLIEYYVIDFLQKLPKDFDKTELPNEQIIYQKLLALTKVDIKQWHLKEINNCFYSLDDIAEDIEQKTRKEHKTAFLPAVLVKILYNYQLFIQKKAYYGYFALDIIIGYFDWIQYNLENENNLIPKNIQIYLEQFNANLIQLKAKS